VAAKSASVGLDGKSIDVEFVDGAKYRFHTEWIKDSSPGNVGVDEYRRDPAQVFTLPAVTAIEAVSVSEGSAIEITFNDSHAERFNSKWLHSTAPFVGKLLTSSPATDTVEHVSDTGMMQGPERHAWHADNKIPEFDFNDIANNVDNHIAFVECVLFQPGVALIHGVPPPEDLEDELRVGAPLENAVMELIGRMNQHTNRTTRYSVTHAKAGIEGEVEPEPIQKSMDYDCRHKLPMHTDHSQFPGTPGYLQFMQNLQGPVTSYVCDGLAVAKHMESHFPDEYRLLTEVSVTHSFRNRLYTRGGHYRDIGSSEDSSADPADPVDPYEVCHTHPVIMLAGDGSIERIAQSETKRGVCAIPYELYARYMQAYRHWTKLVDDPKYVHKFDWPENGVVVCNNYRILHGRADLAPGDERTLIVGYTGKGITDNRYRMLRQLRAERDLGCEHDPLWMSRLPNQVLSRMLSQQ
jgi:alpha-ketoglutarate-dependent taurine dioxygenase